MGVKCFRYFMRFTYRMWKNFCNMNCCSCWGENWELGEGFRVSRAQARMLDMNVSNLALHYTLEAIKAFSTAEEVS